MSSNILPSLEESRTGSSTHETAVAVVSTLSPFNESIAVPYQARASSRENDRGEHELANDDDSFSGGMEELEDEAGDGDLEIHETMTSDDTDAGHRDVRHTDGGHRNTEYRGAVRPTRCELQTSFPNDSLGNLTYSSQLTDEIRMQLLRTFRDSPIYDLLPVMVVVDDEQQDNNIQSKPWRRILPSLPSIYPDRFHEVPSEKGASLMDSGSFGFNDVETISSTPRLGQGKKKKLAMRIFERELAIQSPAQQRINQKLMAQVRAKISKSTILLTIKGMIPSSKADMIIEFRNPVYSGQFSNDGTFFFSVNKDFKVHMYDTSNPYHWKYYKTVTYPFGRWTLTDASLSPDNEYLAYTSIQSSVCLAPTDPNDVGDPYTLDLAAGPNDPRSRHFPDFGIWSIRFTGDGRHLVAGTTGGLIVVYDIESRRPIHKINGHDEDVNAVSLADTSSPHILYSGSDDTTLKIWDTRSMGDNRAAGTFIGHIEGLTYIDSKGDGRYILSNGKDQSAKLWDVRMVMPPQQYEQVRSNRISNHGSFDYRYGRYNENLWYKDPHDCSLVTYRGHRVLKTLIRCHFSPPQSTNSRYIYSGSDDGMVYIWNMDATLVGVIDVYRATGPDAALICSNEPDNLMEFHEALEWRTCVRDASWHPTAPVVAASAWNGRCAENGTCTIHSWNDDANYDEAETKMGLRVDHKLNTSHYFHR